MTSTFLALNGLLLILLFQKVLLLLVHVDRKISVLIVGVINTWHLVNYHSPN